MDKPLFQNGAYHLHYRQLPTPSGAQAWQCVTPEIYQEARRFHFMQSIIYALEPERWMDYEVILTQPGFEFIRTKRWNARNYLGEIIFTFFAMPNHVK